MSVPTVYATLVNVDQAINRATQHVSTLRRLGLITARELVAVIDHFNQAWELLSVAHKAATCTKNPCDDPTHYELR
jgi:hypothetical protein